MRLRAIALVVAACAMSSPAHASLHSDFEAARSLFTSGQYEDAAQLFARVLAEPLDPTAPDYKKRREILEAARPVYAACLVALGRPSEADRIILEQLRDDPFYEPAPGQFAQPVMLRYIAVREEHLEELDALKQRVLRSRQESLLKEERQRERDAARLVKLEELAGTETVVEARSRLVATVPFGIGQLQNGNSGLGAFFAASEAVGVAATVASAFVARDYASFDCREHTDVDCAELERRFDTARAVNWASFAVTGALIVAGVVEAHVSFVPATTTRKPRAIPPRVTLEPAVVAADHGALLGVTGRFF